MTRRRHDVTPDGGSRACDRCHTQGGLDRRGFLGAAARMGMAAAGAGLLASCGGKLELSKHYTELSDSQKKSVLERLEKSYGEAAGREVLVAADGPLSGVFF